MKSKVSTRNFDPRLFFIALSLSLATAAFAQRPTPIRQPLVRQPIDQTRLRRLTGKHPL